MDASEKRVRDQLQTLADTGATFDELQTELRGNAGLTQKAFDGLWLYAWTLVEGQSERLTTGHNGDSDGYINGPH